MAGRPLATAFVRMRPDSTGFKAEASGEIRTSTAGLKATIPLTTDDTRAKLGITDLKGRLDALVARVRDAKVGLAGDKEAQLSLSKLGLKLDQVGRQVANPKIVVDGLAKADIGLQTVNLALDKIDGRKAVATVEIKQKTSLLGKAANALALSGGTIGTGGLGGVGGGGVGGAGAAGEGAQAGAGALSNPLVAGGVGAVAAAALPFIAQALSGAIVLSLGTGLAGLAIFAASKLLPVKLAFADLGRTASADLAKIGTPFQGVLLNIFTIAKQTLNILTGPVVAAVRSIAAPFQQFVDALLRGFGQPAVKESIAAIAKSFDALLKALTPGIPANIKAIADGFTAIAVAVAKNPKAFADFINFLFRVVAFSLQVVAGLTLVANFIEKTFGPTFIKLTEFFTGTLLFEKGKAVIQGLWNGMIAVWDSVTKWFSGIAPTLTSYFRAALTWLVVHGEHILQGLWNGMIAVWGAITHWFSGIFPTLSGYFRSALTWLLGHGEHIIQGLWNGMIAVWNVAWRWFQGIAPTLGGYFRAALTWLLVHGEHIIQGLWNGMITVWNAAWRWFQGIAPTLGGYFRAALSWLFVHGEHIIQGLWNGLITVWGAAWRWFQGIAPTLGGYFRAAGTWLVQHGRDIIAGLFGGMITQLGNVGNWVRDHIFNPIVNGIKSIFGIHSPSTVMSGLGGHLVSGFIQGMLTGNISEVITKIFGSSTNALLDLLHKGLVDVTKLPAAVVNKLRALGAQVAGLFKSIWDDLFGGGGGGPGSGPLGSGASAGEMANGLQLYHYLLKNVFRNSPQAAAGATASIWGESTWNPFAQGSGGRGLIGWTPPGTISNAAFLGGMATQLPAIIRFINTSGDWGVINRMISAAGGGASVFQEANMWGVGVERFGINDVHPQGVSLASSFIGRAGGGIINEPVVGVGLRSGSQWRFGEKGSEWVTPGGGPPGASNAMLGALLAEQRKTNALLAANPAALSDALNGVARRGASRAYYGVR